MPKQMKVPDLVQQLGKLKQQEAKLKEKIKQATVDLYIQMQKIGTDTVGTNEIGKATAVYKTQVIISPQGFERVAPIDEAISSLAMNLKSKKDEREEMEKTLLMEGLAKEDRVFSFIKYTAPKPQE